jgi:hypothetical protein
MPRLKGTPKTGGRKTGTLNKATIEVKQACAEIVDDPVYRRNLAQRAMDGKLAPAVEALLWYYAKGKPKEIVDVNHSQRLAQLTDEDLKGEMERLLAKM